LPVKSKALLDGSAFLLCFLSNILDIGENHLVYNTNMKFF